MPKRAFFYKSLLIAVLLLAAMFFAWMLAEKNITAKVEGGFFQTIAIILGVLLISFLVTGIAWSILNTKNTAIKIAEKLTLELARSENQFKTMSEFSPIGIFLTDAQGQCTYTNKSFQGLSSMGAAEVIADGWFAAIHPDDWEKIYQDWTQAVKNAASFENQFRFRGQGVSQSWMKIKVTPVTDPSGLVGFLGIVEDITEIWRRDEAFRENEERLSQILSSALDAVVSIDSEGNVIGWNPQAELIFGWKREEVMGQTFVDLIFAGREHWDQREQIRELLVSREGSMLKKRIETSAVHMGGRELPIEIAISPVKYRGTFIFSAFIRDISEQKRAEEMIHERTRTLERLNNLMVDRELRMIELKKEISDLKKSFGVKL